MTTIACDGKSMAGDGQRESRGTIILTSARKVRRLSDGRIVGTCGLAHCGIAFEKWLANGGDKPELHEDFSALVLCPDGTVACFDEGCTPLPVDLPTAIGSGMDFAIGAMEAGCTPLEAVEIASRRDSSTGGQITHLIPEKPLRAVV